MYPNPSKSHRSSSTYDVFVGNLPPDVNEKNVGKLFCKFGEIHSISVRDNNTNPGTRIAYVRFYCEVDCLRACEECNNHEFNGFCIVVRKTDSRKRNRNENAEKQNQNRQQQLLHVDRKVDKNNQQNKGSDSANITDRPNQDWPQVGKFACPPAQENNAAEDVVVSFVEGAIVVWVQTLTEEKPKQLSTLSEELSSYCSHAPKAKLPATLSSFKMYGAQFSEDGMWYRCVTKQGCSKDMVCVHYVDYGNSEEISRQNLVELPTQFSLVRPFAKKIILHGLKPNKYNDPKAMAFIKEFTMGKPLKLRCSNRLTDGTGYYGILTLDGVDIQELMCEHGFAIQKQITKSCFSASFSNTDRPTPDANLQMAIKQDLSSSSDLWSNLQATKQELERTKQDRDLIVLELANVRGMLKNLQREYTSMPTKFIEKSLAQQLQSVAGLANQIRKLRNQFPTDGRINILEKGIQLATSSDKISELCITTLRPMNSTLAVYQSLQKEINLCKDQKELDELIVKRDETRIQLYESITAFITEISNLPLEERFHKIQEIGNTLENEYMNFLISMGHSVPCLDDLVSEFMNWKMKKEEEFCDIRLASDAHKNAVSEALSRFEQHLDLNSCPSSVDAEYSDLDSLLKNFVITLQHEIAVTDLEHGKTANFMATVIYSLKRELNKEKLVSNDLHKHSVEVSKYKNSIELWLYQKPSLNEVLDVRKNIRVLKSKLRHKLADKQDLEENEGVNEELREIEMEIHEIRQELHSFLIEEDRCMFTLATIADKHFPELFFLHADLGLDKVLTYGGLLRIGRDIDHFSLGSQIKPGVYNSWFGEEEIFIKEYLVEDNVHLTKEEFLQEAQIYSTINHPSVLPIHAVFFSKNQRQAYVQTPAVGQFLSDILPRKFMPKQIQRIILGVCQGLFHLHSRNMSHGEINPSTVLITEDMTAVISEPDFSLTMVNRSKKVYISINELKFCAPENMNGSYNPFATDLYNIGLLILLIHYPEIQFPLSQNGTPDIAHIDLVAPLQDLMHSMLSIDPQNRIRTNQVLNSEYFSMHFPDEDSSAVDTSISDSNVATADTVIDNYVHQEAREKTVELTVTSDQENAGIREQHVSPERCQERIIAETTADLVSAENHSEDLSQPTVKGDVTIIQEHPLILASNYSGESSETTDGSSNSNDESERSLPDNEYSSVIAIDEVQKENSVFTVKESNVEHTISIIRSDGDIVSSVDKGTEGNAKPIVGLTEDNYPSIQTVEEKFAGFQDQASKHLQEADSIASNPLS